MDKAVIDFETSGLNYWEPDFKVLSLSICWKEDELFKHAYSDKPEIIEAYLKRLADLKTPIIAHNISFEYGVVLCKYPNIKPFLG